MAIVTTKSTTIANRDAVPLVANDTRLERGVLKSSIGSAKIDITDFSTSYLPLVAVPSNALVRSVKFSCSAGMTGLTGDIGVFKNTRDSGNAPLGIIANTGTGTFFAAAKVLSALINKQELMDAGTNYPILKQEMPFWQALGLPADLSTTYDLAVKLTANSGGVIGYVSLQVDYVDGGS
jgi:hypothetical protein